MSSILSAHDQEMICYVFQSLKTPPDIDIDKLSSLCGHKSKSTTYTSFYRRKTKLLGFGTTNDDNEEADVDADGDADVEDTPKPVVKKGRGKKAAVVKPEEPATDEEDEPKAATVKPKAKGKARATRASTAKAATPKAAPVGRSTRASLRARKSMATGDSSADESEIKKPEVVLKAGRVKRPKIEDVQIEPTTAGAAADETVVDADEPTADANTLKRAAAEPASDIDELAQPDRVKRVKHDIHNNDLESSVGAAIDAAVDATFTVVSTNPTIESYIVNDPDAVDINDHIRMHAGYQPAPNTEDRPRADVEDGVDIRSDVASAADSGERDI